MTRPVRQAHPARHGAHCASRCIAHGYVLAAVLVASCAIVGAIVPPVPLRLAADTDARPAITRSGHGGPFVPTVELDASQIIDRRSPAIGS